jgi:hypothetical protein
MYCIIKKPSAWGYNGENKHGFKYAYDTWVSNWILIFSRDKCFVKKMLSSVRKYSEYLGPLKILQT